MLESTFVFLKGIGKFTERCLWDHGIADWSTFLAHPSLPGIAQGRKTLYDAELATAIEHLRQGHSRFFAHCLKPRDHWRLFETFRARTAFLDIETNGEPASVGYVTVVGLYANGTITTLVRDETLSEDRLNEELSQYDLLITFFGTGFDLPYLRTQFPGVNLDHPHFDLCFGARRLGLRGGLKQIESDVGLSRPTEIDGLSGWDAVRLWQQWWHGDGQAKQLLLQYNEADCRNLEQLAELFYAQLVMRYGPAHKHIIP